MLTLLATLLLALWAFVRELFGALLDLRVHVRAERPLTPYRQHERELAEREPERIRYLARPPHRGRPAPQRALPRPPARLRLPQ